LGAFGSSDGSDNERDFPHVVELLVPPRGFGDASSAFGQFHLEMRIPERRGRGRRDEQLRDYVRWCFPTADLADAFRARFGGVVVVPARQRKR
jgi:hypothetical protein